MAVSGIDAAAEGATLAAMIADEGFRAEVLCEPEDLFGQAGHLALRRAIGALVERGDAVDAVIVAREAQVLGFQRADDLVRGLPAASGKYLSLLAQARLRRKTQEIGRALLLSEANPEQALATAAESAVAALSGVGQRVVSVSEAGDAAFRMARAGAPRVLRTGIRTLDETLRLIGPGDLVVVGARPSVGKTAYAVQVARRTAASGTGALFCSLEMDPKAISLRMVAQEANLPFVALAGNELDAKGWERAARALKVVGSLPLSIGDASGATPANIRAAAMRAKARFERGGGRLGVVVVDYLQIMTPTRPERTRDREIAQISAALKAMAKSMGVVVIALSQLNRSLESRQDKRPTLADLRESGAIEQDADTVILLHRAQKQSSGAEIFVAKQRNGETGSVRATWHGPTMAFGEIGDAYEDLWGDETVLQ